MKKKLAYFLAALLVLISLFSVTAFADFGDYAGDSDWGWEAATITMITEAGTYMTEAPEIPEAPAEVSG